MGWRDFQITPQREFMEIMELMPEEPPLIPLIPLIPIETISKTKVQPDTVSAYCESYGGHCSVKITGVYPDDCIRKGCESYKPAPDKTLTIADINRCYCGHTEFRTGIDGWEVCARCQVPKASLIKQLRKRGLA